MKMKSHRVTETQSFRIQVLKAPLCLCVSVAILICGCTTGNNVSSGTLWPHRGWGTNVASYWSTNHYAPPGPPVFPDVPPPSNPPRR